MIIGIDHLALTAIDLDPAVACLESLGYTLHFIERNVLNPETKRRFLHAYSPQLACAFLIPPGPTIPIEVLVEGSELHSGGTGYQSLWTARPPGAEEGISASFSGSGSIYAALGRNMERFVLQELGIDGVREGSSVAVEDKKFGIRAVAFAVPSLEPAMQIWQKGLGFSLSIHCNGNARYATGSFSSPFQKCQCEVHIMENPAGAPVSHLDDAGFPCLAFTSTSVDRDIDRLLNLGARDFSDIFEIIMNGARLRIVFFRGAGGEILELIEPLKQGGGL